MAKAKGGLGRGLGALLPEIHETEMVEQQGEGRIVQLALEEVYPNPDQPRKRFDEDQLTDLVDSIREQGIIQPIIVVARPDGYMIVAGERRWRASKKLGLENIPAVIRELSDAQVFETALIENIQRSDLNPIEEARGYQYLQERFGYNGEQLASRVGKSRSVIVNTTRLLSLPEDVQQLVLEEKLSPGHVRPIISIENPEWQSDFAREIYQSRLSVREVEKMVNEIKKRGQITMHKAEVLFEHEEPPMELTTDLKVLQEQMQEKLGTRVKIKNNGKKGKLEIEFYGEEDLKRIIDVLGGEYY